MRLRRLTLATALVLVFVGAGALGLRLWVDSWRPAHGKIVFKPSPGDQLLESLQRRWGKKLYSQWDEETLIRDFFQDRRGGFFVDVGAGDYKFNSTTFYLEKHLGWRGIAIDGVAGYKADYERFRPATRFFTYFVSDKTEEQRSFFISNRDKRLSSGDKKYVAEQVAAPTTQPYNEVKVRAITLNDLLAREKVARVDFLSMDIETGEPAALAGFDIRRYRPELVCVELQSSTRDRLLAYFGRNGYVRVGRYGLVDTINGYFTPRR